LIKPNGEAGELMNCLASILDAPLARYDRVEFIWILQGETVAEVTANEARLSSGLTFYRRACA
jgi:hypothetical protein